MASEFPTDGALIDRVAALPAVQEAAQAAVKLIELWPLNDAMQMDNDVKYAENLQVRMTRTMAAMMTGQDVTAPDAEFVYEGAESIPGRPQAIVDALLAANDAYDTISEYSETGDVTLFAEAAAVLAEADGVVSAADGAAARHVLDAVEALVEPKAVDNGHVPPSDDVQEAARRFALVIVACDALYHALAVDGAEHCVARVLPVMLYANELGERLTVPRVYMSADEFRGALCACLGDEDAGDTADASDVVTGDGETAIKLATVIAPLAASEWNRHREDVLWNPAEAKKRAKEEDERKNKEALAAKFAHVKDDPTKETVEL